jgi:hypothetical protein
MPSLFFSFSFYAHHFGAGRKSLSDYVWRSILGIMNFVSTLWWPFELEFAELEKDMKQQRADVDEEIRLAVTQVAIRERNDASCFGDSFTKNFTMWRSADEVRNNMMDKAKSRKSANPLTWVHVELSRPNSLGPLQ